MPVNYVKTKDDLDKLILKNKDRKYMLIDFYATWCGPCKAISPYLEELSKKYQTILFVKVDVDESRELTEHYNVKSLPTFMMFETANRIEPRNRVVGAKKTELEDMLKLFDQYSVKISDDF